MIRRFRGDVACFSDNSSGDSYRGYTLTFGRSNLCNVGDNHTHAVHKTQRLPDVLVRELGIFRLQLVPIRVEGHGLNDAPHRQAHSSKARLPVHDRGIGSYAVERTCHGIAPEQCKVQPDDSIGDGA